MSEIINKMHIIVIKQPQVTDGLTYENLKIEKDLN